ncbi:MAG: hypothetical protein HYS13_24505 [Planctomycetia bacterium]|nr:hypothetical protein [Planctomycetia bacterium]
MNPLTTTRPLHLALAALLFLVSQPAFADDPARMEVGARVFAFWESDGFWYPAAVEEISGEDVKVRYTDNTIEWKAPGQVGLYTVAVGDRLEGNWLGRNSYYQGSVAQRDGERIRIRYDDGDVEETTIAQTRLQLYQPKGFFRGQKIYARWKPDGYWYPATIHRFENGHHLVRYEDLTWEWLKEKDLSTYTVEGGNNVEINWQGRGLYYKARVLSRRGNELRVQYDNGEEGGAWTSQVRAWLSQ